jgi:cell division protein ZapE
VAAGEPARAEQIRVKGRNVAVPRAVNGAARFTFAELCETPLGAADYLQLARTYHTVFLDDVPALSEKQRNAARRFIDLIDALYDNRVRLVASAAAEPAALYPAGDGAENFLRTASRLIEMRSHDYLEAAGQHRQPAGASARPAR